MANGPGGRIAPDGRQAQAPGVGAQSKRHDLETPATPGLHDSDLQQGDVQAMERSQQVAPIPKRKQVQKPATAQRTTPRQRSGGPGGGPEVPDPIEFAASRGGASTVTGGQGGMRQVDASAWYPLLERMAFTPNGGGSMVANIANSLAQMQRKPVVSELSFVDLDELDTAIGG